ncbi:MAG: hypothetical protein R3325_17000 [Thermoanaerobaculia bacterium]|nr:hypothetical protein [Thermoanaerobaculia bacterium]
MTRRPSLGSGWRRAVGEFLLIVAGILVALWIEDWRQARIDRATEIEYLSRLTIDVDQDLIDLENQIAHTPMREEQALAVLDFLDSERAADRSVLQAFNQAGWIAFFRFNRSTMDDLLSTGNLSLLGDKSLVRQLNNYYRSGDFLREFDDAKKLWIWEGYRRSLDHHIPSRLFTLDPDEEERLAAVGWDALRGDRDVRAGLEHVMTVAAVERRHLERVREAANELGSAVADRHARLTGS